MVAKNETITVRKIERSLRTKFNGTNAGITNRGVRTIDKESCKSMHCDGELDLSLFLTSDIFIFKYENKHKENMIGI